LVKNSPVIDWLLEENQPSVRYYTLVDILDCNENDPEVREAYSMIPRKGWANEILKRQKREGYWEPRKPIDPTPQNILRNPANFLRWIDFLYQPSFVATVDHALVLSDLGLDSRDLRIRKVADLFFNYKLKLGSIINIYNDEVCVVGNAARILTRFDYSEDLRVKKLFNRLVEDQKEDGGWHCYPSKVGTLDSWEALGAYAALPKQRRTRSINRSIEKGAEFYLERRLFEEGKRKYLPWFRFHYPSRYFYDILIGLDLLTKLGYASDSRLKRALEILNQKKQSDGTWLLDKVHPDLGPDANYDLDVKKVKPFALEEASKPSKWITLTALRVLKRVEDAS
jgi:hypothetical protein